MAENLNEIGHHPPPPVWASSTPRVTTSSGAPTVDGYSVDDINFDIVGGGIYVWDGTTWNLMAGGGGGAAQTPWAQDIDGDSFSLSNVDTLTANTLLLDGTDVGSALVLKDVLFGAFADPNGNVIGTVRDVYKSVESLGGDGSIWVKQTGTATNTGWI